MKIVYIETLGAEDLFAGFEADCIDDSFDYEYGSIRTIYQQYSLEVYPTTESFLIKTRTGMTVREIMLELMDTIPECYPIPLGSLSNHACLVNVKWTAESRSKGIYITLSLEPDRLVDL